MAGRGRPPAAAALPLNGSDCGWSVQGEEGASDASDQMDDPSDGGGGEGGGGGRGGRRSRRSTGPFYAVAVGRKIGVFRTWDEAESSVRAFSGAVYKKFSTEREARAFVQLRAVATTATDAAVGDSGGGDGAGSSAGAPADSPAADPWPMTRPHSPPPPPGHVGPFYAVARGHKVGIYETWAHAQEAIRGASGALHKRFSTREEAESFLAQHRLPTKRAGTRGGAGITGATRGGASSDVAAAPLRDDTALATQPASAPRKRGRPKKGEPSAVAAAAPAVAAPALAPTQGYGAIAAADGAAAVAAAASDRILGSGGGGGREADTAEAGDTGEGGGMREAAAAEEEEEGEEEEEPSVAPVSDVPYGPEWQSHAPLYYAVARGRQVGVFASWVDARGAVAGVRGARYKRFKRLSDAYAYLAAWAASERAAPTRPSGLGWEELLASGVNSGEGGSVGSGGGGDTGQAAAGARADGGIGGSFQDALEARSSGAAKAEAEAAPKDGKEPRRVRQRTQQRQQRQAAEAEVGSVEAEEEGDGSQLLRFESLSGVVDPTRRYRLEFDGGSRRNPGDAGFGAVLAEAASGVHVEYAAGPLAGSSNNVAEWSALAAGMQVAVDLGVRHLVVQGDSELVCRQVSGRYSVHTPALQPLAARVSRLRAGLESFEVVHVPRSQNAAADLLSNIAMDAEQAVAVVAGVTVMGVGGGGSAAGDGDTVWQHELLQSTMQELGEAALASAREAVAASAAAVSDSGRSTSDRGVTECPPPLATRGSAAGSLREFRRVLIALACAGHGLLDC